MPKKEYDWSQGPAKLLHHSLAKLDILRDYVQSYIKIVTMGGTVPLRLTLIDGFAGGGEYVMEGGRGEIKEGSPVVLVNAVRAAMVELNSMREKPAEVDVDFVFIEEKAANYEHLKEVLARRFDKEFLTSKVRLIHGDFKAHVDEVIARLRASQRRKPNPIFILDQYGYSDVPVELIQRIMQGFKHAEIFLTLAVDNIAAFKKEGEAAIHQLRTSLQIDTSNIEKLLREQMSLEEVEALDRNERHQVMVYIQCILHEVFAKHSGALYYTPFFIKSTKSHRAYWLLHLANNARANDAVKEIHWRYSNYFQHHGRPGMRMLVPGFDLSKPPQTQETFDFSVSARDVTNNALIGELPARLRDEKYAKGISASDLYAEIGTETPASKTILKASLNELCSIGILEKKGGKNEQRRTSTELQDSDILKLSRQRLLFSIPDLRKKGR